MGVLLVPEFLIEVVVRGLDAQDDHVLGLLSQTDIVAIDQLAPDEFVLSAAIEAEKAILAGKALHAAVTALLPEVEFLRVYRDLVGVSDIAERLGVTREAVRHWTTGRRGPGGFPVALAPSAGGAGIWEWGTVNRWLEEQFSLGDGVLRPSLGDMGYLDHWFSIESTYRQVRVSLFLDAWAWGETRTAVADQAAGIGSRLDTVAFSAGLHWSPAESGVLGVVAEDNFCLAA